MDKAERIWFGVLIAVAVLFNILMLSPLVPWQQWLLWSHPEPDQVVEVSIEDYQFTLPAEPIEIKAGDYVDFRIRTNDVTYGFGVFRADYSLVFQIQVLPGHPNHILWKFDVPGKYDIRSTEYSGPRHSEMHVPEAILVTP